MKILAIESSADDTGIAIVEYCDGQIHVQAHVIASQIDLHKKWGGIVPNLAAREHVKNIFPLLKSVFDETSCTKDDIDLIAVTEGPGLIPALLVGVNAAKSLAYAWNKPLLGVHHIAGHLYASWINDPQPQFPVLALVVSGGHTQLMLMRTHCDFEIIGHTHDDAVGEAFDKVARLLGLPYPGGPEIATRADAFESKKNTVHYGIDLPHPMRNGDHYDFSFSGLKTAALYWVQDFRKDNHLADDAPLPEDFVAEFSWAFQKKAVEVLLHKTKKALDDYTPASVVLAGGVSANKHLRAELEKLVAEHAKKSPATFHVPDVTYCLDNATMIAAAAAYKWHIMSTQEKRDTQSGWKNVYAQARVPIDTL